MAYGPFGDLLRQYIARKHGLTQTRLAHLIGYDQAVLTRMAQGGKDLTGPSGRERVVLIIGALRDEGVLHTQAEADALLKAGGMSPLYEGQPAEAALLHTLKASPVTPGPEPAPQPRTNLPASLSSFIGRESEMAEVTRLLGTTRLLTLTGAGGCGKTRLAVEVGAAWATASAAPAITPAFPDGVWLVEFAALAEGQLVADTVAAAFGLQAASRTSEEVLVDHLCDKQLLLILDNCEHLIADCAGLAVKLLQACPRLRLLVTSREGLNVPGEVTWRVPSLAHDEALALFVERARAVQPGFAIDETNNVFVERICERLDAMPLALELAAARLRSFSAEQVAARLDDAFHILTGGSRVALPRHQTLRATIDWSYQLLTEEERCLLRELSVFAGGWTLEAAEAVHGSDVLDLLDQLVGKSLVQTVQTSFGLRYAMLEMIRQYAGEKQIQVGGNTATQARARHLTFFHQLGQNLRSNLVGGIEEKSRRAKVVQEIPNIRAAVEWSVETNQWLVSLDLIDCLLDTWNEPGYLNVLTGFVGKSVLSNPTVNDRSRCRGLLFMAYGLTAKGDMVGCIEWSERALDLARQIEDDALVYSAELLLSFTRTDYAKAMSGLERIRDAAHRTDNSFIEAEALHHMGYRMTWEGHYQQAIEAFKKADVFYRDKQNYARVGAQWRLGQVYLAQADYARARNAFEQSLTLARDSGRRTSVVLVDLGTVGIYTGELDTARRALVECFDWEYRHDNMERLAQGLVLGAGLAHVLGNLDAAAQLLGAAAAIRKAHHTHGVCERELFLEYDRRLPAVRAAMEPAAFERAWNAGQALTLKEAMAMALAL